MKASILPQGFIDFLFRHKIYFGWQIDRLHASNKRMFDENIYLGRQNAFLDSEVSRLEYEKSQLLACLRINQVEKLKAVQ